MDSTLGTKGGRGEKMLSIIGIKLKNNTAIKQRDPQQSEQWKASILTAVSIPQLDGTAIPSSETCETFTQVLHSGSTIDTKDKPSFHALKENAGHTFDRNKQYSTILSANDNIYVNVQND
nr:uncharacterized protein LOC111420573 [Onthophagus taurus]